MEGGTGRKSPERYWLLIERGDTEICKTSPCLDEDLYVTAEAEAFVKWHAGQLSWAQATREGRIQLDGSPPLVRVFPTWNARRMFAHIRPASRTEPALNVALRILTGAGLAEPLQGSGHAPCLPASAAGARSYRSYDSFLPDADTLIR